jgi:hypothetical protein
MGPNCNYYRYRRCLSRSLASGMQCPRNLKGRPSMKKGRGCYIHDRHGQRPDPFRGRLRPEPFLGRRSGSWDYGVGQRDRRCGSCRNPNSIVDVKDPKLLAGSWPLLIGTESVRVVASTALREGDRRMRAPAVHPYRLRIISTAPKERGCGGKIRWRC